MGVLPAGPAGAGMRRVEHPALAAARGRRTRGGHRDPADRRVAGAGRRPRFLTGSGRVRRIMAPPRTHSHLRCFVRRDLRAAVAVIVSLALTLVVAIAPVAQAQSPEPTPSQFCSVLT